VTPPVAVSAQTRTVCPIVHLVTGRFSSLIGAQRGDSGRIPSVCRQFWSNVMTRAFVGTNPTDEPITSRLPVIRPESTPIADHFLLADFSVLIRSVPNYVTSTTGTLGSACVTGVLGDRWR
jgi:hypothetical protein